MSFALPTWRPGDFWRVEATLSHMETGTSIFGSRIIGVENLWRFEVEATAPTTHLNVLPEVPADHPFAGHRYTLSMQHDEGGIFLASYTEASPSSVKPRTVLAHPRCPVFFRPGDSLGYLFDMPWLRPGLGPTFGEEHLAGEVPFVEERVRYDGGLRFIWSYAFPTGTTVRTTVEWDDGAFWYRRLMRERFNPADMIHTREIQASVRWRPEPDGGQRPRP